MNDKETYIVARWAYSLGEPIMDDDAYNILHEKMVAKNLLPEYTNRTWSEDPCPSELLRSIGREDLIHKIIPSLDKSESMESIRFMDEAVRYYESRKDKKFLCSYKVDGFHTILDYVKGKLVYAQTRGRSSDALDISHVIPYLPQQIDCEEERLQVKLEACLTDANFYRLQKLLPERDLKSQRSSVRSALAEHPELITFKAFYHSGKGNIFQKYMKLKRIGFETPDMIICNGSEVIETVRILSDSRYSIGYRTDGVVASEIDEKSDDVRALRLYNWKSSIYTSTILGYEESYGRHFIGMKLIIEPVETDDGATQRLIDIDNLDRITKLKLYPGKHVAFTKVSDAVADINEQVTILLNE